MTERIRRTPNAAGDFPPRPREARDGQAELVMCSCCCRAFRLSEEVVACSIGGLLRSADKVRVCKCFLERSDEHD
jgi:hypothetical protein